MPGYRPDWIGFLATAVGFAIPLLVGLRIWPQPRRRNAVIIGAVLVGVALSILLRTGLRSWGV